MLVLSRKSMERIQIGDNIVITVLEIQGNKVRLGIAAPKEIRVLRSELKEVIPDLPLNHDTDIRGFGPASGPQVLPGLLHN